MSQIYYLVCDEDEQIVAIHRTPGSATAIVLKIMTEGLYRRLDVIKVETDAYGRVTKEEVTSRHFREESPATG